MQIMVLHRALHPRTQKKVCFFFYKDAIAHAPWLNRVHSLSRRSGIIVWFGKVIENSLVAKQNQMLPISSGLLCSYILGTKEKLRVLVPSDCHEQLLAGRNECSPCEEKAAVPLSMIRGFWALVWYLGFNIYPWLLAETHSKRHSTDETEVLNLSNLHSKYRVWGKD